MIGHRTKARQIVIFSNGRAFNHATIPDKIKLAEFSQKKSVKLFSLTYTTLVCIPILQFLRNKNSITSRSAHRTPNFLNPEFQFPQFKLLQRVSLFLMYISSIRCTFIWEIYSKSKWTKNSGFVKLGVRWAERDNGLCI